MSEDDAQEGVGTVKEVPAVLAAGFERLRALPRGSVAEDVVLTKVVHFHRVKLAVVGFKFAGAFVSANEKGWFCQLCWFTSFYTRFFKSNFVEILYPKRSLGGL